MRGFTLAALAAALGGCVTESSFRSEMLPRAAFELSCPAEQVTVSHLGNNSWGVAGCGKRAVYIYVPNTGYVNNTGLQRDAAAVAQAPRPPAPEGFVLVPLRAYVLTKRDDPEANQTARRFAAEAPAIVSEANRLFEPAGVYFVLEGLTEPLALSQDVPWHWSALKEVLPSQSEKRGFRLFFVPDLDANGADLGGGDVVVNERPAPRLVAGDTADPVARVIGHVLGSGLGLTPSNDEHQLMALGTSGVALDAAQAKKLHARALHIPGALLFDRASDVDAFPEATAAIRARAARRQTAANP